MIESFPLAWPFDYKRTPDNKRIRSKFQQSMEKSQQRLRREIELLGGKNIVISTDIPTRKDGMMYADYMNKKIADPGVAIYFMLPDKIDYTVMCCDQYERVWENIYALALAVEALRGIDRWGVSEFMSRTFTGFKALPEAQSSRHWSKVLGCSRDASPDTIKQAYRLSLQDVHPDKGGTREAFDEVQRAYKEAIG